MGFQLYVPMRRAYAGFLDWLERRSIGVEIQELIHPGAATPVAPDPSQELADFWGETLLGRSLPVTFHGPILSEHLYESAGRAAALHHLERAMDSAAAVGARRFVVHPCLGAFARSGGHFDDVLRAWEAALHLAKARNLTLLLENTDEESPDRLRRLTASIESPALGLCLDVGHARLRSNLPADSWVEAFGSDLHYVHLYNVAGKDEAHRGLASGDIDVEAFLATLHRLRPGAGVCLEMDLPAIQESLAWLVSRGILADS